MLFVIYLHIQGSIAYSHRYRHVKPRLEALINMLSMLMWARALRRSGMGVFHVGVDVGAGDAEVDVIYISFIVSVQYIGY